MNKSKQEKVIKELKHEKVIGLQYFGPKRAKLINYWIALAEDIKTEDNLKWSQLFLLLTGVLEQFLHDMNLQEKDEKKMKSI